MIEWAPARLNRQELTLEVALCGTLGNFDVTSFLTPGFNTLSLTTGTVQDALSLNLALINLPGGAAPPNAIPEPATMILLGTGLVGIAGKAWRRRKTLGARKDE